MPRGSDIELRDRALVAFTILTGIRDGAIASLRLKHLDIVCKLVIQEPKEVSIKFSKRIDTFFFNIDDEIEQIVIDWVKYLRKDKLFSLEYPLFPKTAIGQDENDCFVVAGLSREFWTNPSPIRHIFKRAFKNAILPYYSPHRFRNTLVSLVYQICKTPEKFKAWSQNLGHGSPLTTFTSYGSIDQNRQGELIRRSISNENDTPVTVARLEEMLEQHGLLKG